jgi:GNAT acetyltransferase-like protein
VPDFKILTLRDFDAWKSALRDVKGAGISSQPEYCSVLEKNGDGDAECIVYTGSEGKIVYPIIRMSLNSLPFDRGTSKDEFDISTPYGYGGFYVDCKGAAREKLMRDFRSRLTEYALDTNIISEFIRFDPIAENHIFGPGLIDSVRRHNENLFIDLTQDEEEILAGCRSRIRTGIRQTARLGLTMERNYSADTITQFIELYHAAMRRRGNSGYLNFKAEFFANLFEKMEGYIDLFTVQEEGNVLGAAITLRFGDTVEYFLAANRRLKNRAYVNHFLIIQIAKWAKQQGFRKFHLGGGSESIMYFKNSFTQSSFPYYVGNHVFDKKRYAALVTAGQTIGVIPKILPPFFFPSYRAYISTKADRALLNALAKEKAQ